VSQGSVKVRQVSYSADKGLISRIYKELKNTKQQKNKQMQLMNGQMNPTDSSQKKKHKCLINT
jgi:hypothetical protein